MTRRDRRGFTLIEVVVALAVSGMVLLGARALLAGLADSADRLAAFTSETNRTANADRMLRSLIGRIEVGTPDAGRFAGDESSARFTTWCDVAAGWQERCEATIAIDTADGRSALTARLDDGRSLVLRRGFRIGQLRYLIDAESSGRWFRVWGTGVTAPLAIGVILDRDTLVVRIGERG